MPNAQGPDSLSSLPRRSSGVMAPLTLSLVLLQDHRSA